MISSMYQAKHLINLYAALLLEEEGAVAPVFGPRCLPRVQDCAGVVALALGHNPFWHTVDIWGSIVAS